MRLFSSKKGQQLIGVDIATTSVKVVQLQRQSRFFHLKAYAVFPLASGLVVDRSITDSEAVGDAVRQALKSAGISSKLAATALSGSAVITKIIDMDEKLGDNEREAQIRLDADQYIPYPLDEVNLDFEVLGESEVNPDQVQVLLAASRSENVEQRVETLSMAGLTTKVMDIESHAIERAFSLMFDTLPNTPQLVALVDIGHTQMTLYIAKEGKFVYSREQLFGGAQLTEAIQARYGLTYDEATTYKKEQSLPDDYFGEVLTPFIDNVIQQITRSLQFYYSSSHYNNVDHIVLCGGSAAIPGLVNMVEEKLDTSVTIANPFVNMSINSKIYSEQLAVDAPSLMAACGLALRSFD